MRESAGLPVRLELRLTNSYVMVLM
ncbi:hypothetical protein LINPERHAP1_LOCUS19411 [Linum perenne]